MTNEPIYDKLEKECKTNNQRVASRVAGWLKDIAQESCEFCDMENKPMAYRFDGIYKEKIYVQHLIPAKLRPNGSWIIKAEVASGPIYANINFCPMCGRNLCREEK